MTITRKHAQFCTNTTHEGLCADAPQRQNPFINITLELEPFMAESIMSTAIEGGIDYWAAVRNVTYANDSFEEVKRPGSDIIYFSYDVRDCENHDEEWTHITYDSVFGALKRLFSTNADGTFVLPMDRLRANFLEDYRDWQGEPEGTTLFGGTMDASDCDAIIQIVAYGTTVFG